MKSTTTIGRLGEDLAVDWLRGHGYTLVKRNYRRRFGEVDVIARQGEYLVFIEVKTRSSGRFGSPFEAVTAKKQQQLSRIAKDYLSRYKLTDTPCRFDVLSVILPKDRPPVIDIVTDAFEYKD